MSPELRDRLHTTVQQAAKLCEGRLPDHPNHPQGRIPIAHIYDVIQGVMEVPARECRDCRFEEILQIVQFCVDNAEEMSIIRKIKHKYQPEPKRPQPSDLKKFL